MKKLTKSIIFSLLSAISGVGFIHADGGVMPYSHKDGRLILFMGSSINPKTGGEAFTDFGGLKDPREDYLTTAAREYIEEAGMWMSKKQTLSQVKSELASAPYIHISKTGRMRDSYRMYFLKISRTSGNSGYEVKGRQRNAKQKSHGKPHKFYEVKNFNWFYADSIKKRNINGKNLMSAKTLKGKIVVLRMSLVHTIYNSQWAKIIKDLTNKIKKPNKQNIKNEIKKCEQTIQLHETEIVKLQMKIQKLKKQL